MWATRLIFGVITGKFAYFLHQLKLHYKQTEYTFAPMGVQYKCFVTPPSQQMRVGANTKPYLRY